VGEECSPALKPVRVAAGVGAVLVSPLSGLRKFMDATDANYMRKNYPDEYYDSTRADKWMTIARSGDKTCTGIHYYCRSKADGGATACRPGQDKEECYCCYKIHDEE